MKTQLPTDYNIY